MVTSLLLLGGNVNVFAQIHDDRPRSLSGISASEAFDVEDDLELDPGSPMINRLLYRAMKSSVQSRDEYCELSKDVDWDQVLKETVDYRFWMMRRRARISRIEKHSVRDAPKEAMIRHFYVCYGMIENSTIPCRLITRTIPKDLAVKELMDEPVEFEGFLYCRTKDDAAVDEASAVVFVADRIGWYPDSTALAKPEYVSLAALGFDVAQFDDVLRSHGKGLGKADSEAFFQMLSAMNNAQDDLAISRQPFRRVGLAELLKDPAKKLGSAVQLTAVCRSCLRMEVPYDDIRNRLGVKEYYQLVVFPRLKTHVLIKEGDKEVALDRYPITICCTELPAGMKPEDLENRDVSIDGYFYRLWKFETEATDRAEISGAVSPLILARAPRVLKASTANLNRFVLVFVLGVIGTIGCLLAYLRISDRGGNSESVLQSLPEKIDVAGMSDAE